MLLTNWAKTARFRYVGFFEHRLGLPQEILTPDQKYIDMIKHANFAAINGYDPTWRFPRIGVPPVIIHFNGIPL